jgi:5-methylcytosine-specific restriction endonuclease McrA
LPLSCFYERSPGVPRQECKACHSERAARWRERSQAKIKLARQRYQETHRDEIRARSKRYREEYPEQIRAKKHAGHIRDRERNLARSKRWQEENPERAAAIKRRYYEANTVAAKARTKAWIKAHPAEKAERQRRDRARKLATSVVRITPDLLAAKLAYWGWRCWLCGGEPTTWDHVKPSTKGGPHILANLRPACQPCNTRKLNRWPFPTHRRC